MKKSPKYRFDLCTTCLEAYRALSHDPRAGRRTSFIPHGMIFWLDEHPGGDPVPPQDHPECLKTIMSLLAARLSFWFNGEIPDELVGLWVAAHEELPEWPGFHRMRLTSEQSKAQLDCLRAGQEFMDGMLAAASEVEEIESEPGFTTVRAIVPLDRAPESQRCDVAGPDGSNAARPSPPATTGPPEEEES